MFDNQKKFQIVRLEQSGKPTNDIVEIESHSWENAIKEAKSVIGHGAKTVADGLIILKSGTAWRLERHVDTKGVN
tara:strand:- start:257 stop:481 length:225 start_codon:yes stop_codon:yes gene_type:complete